MKALKSRKKKSILTIIALILTTVLMSCKTTQSVNVRPFPSPIVDGKNIVEYDQDTNTVSMPLWYWLEITEYVIEVEESL